MKAKFILTIVFALCTLPFQQASAQEGLLMDRCANGLTAPSIQPYLYSLEGRSNGLSCETIRDLNETVSVVNLALLPAAAFIRNPMVSASLAADVAAAGMSFANPVVLGVTIVGGVGIATFYVVLRQSLEDCEKQEREILKQQILDEIHSKYGAVASPGVQLEMSK